MRHTPAYITDLMPNEVIVVGTNLAGKHHGGAAKQAHENFGLEWGIGEGLSGQSYAFPTLGAEYEILSDSRLKLSVKKLFDCACEHPEKIFLLTKVGCGIAGYEESYMKSLFVNPPENVVLPADWKIEIDLNPEEYELI